VDQAAQITLLQWSGASRHRQTITWTHVSDRAQVAALADRIVSDPRVWRNFSMAVAEALELSLDALASGPDCRRRVIDVSGDGVSNEGLSPHGPKGRLNVMQVTVNALAIEKDAADLVAWFYENLIHRDGAFVINASGFADFPEQIRSKLQRETTRQISALGPVRT